MLEILFVCFFMAGLDGKNMWKRPQRIPLIDYLFLFFFFFHYCYCYTGVCSALNLDNIQICVIQYGGKVKEKEWKWHDRTNCEVNMRWLWLENHKNCWKLIFTKICVNIWMNTGKHTFTITNKLGKKVLLIHGIIWCAYFIKISFKILHEMGLTDYFIVAATVYRRCSSCSTYRWLWHLILKLIHFRYFMGQI